MKNIIGIDIGGTKITGIVFDGKRIITDELTVVTPKNLQEFERVLIKLVDFLSANRRITGIGIGMAGKVDPQNGIVAYSPNIKFINDFPLAKLFTKNGFKNVKIDNDAKCFTRAEMQLGAGKGFLTMVGITLGTGIGGGLAARGDVYRGANFGAGEVGHMIYNDSHTFEEIFQKARNERDNKALAKVVGAMLTNVYRLVDPEVVVIGGGVAMDKKRKFLPEAIKICFNNLSSYKIKPKHIKVSKLKNAGALGAALLVS